MSNGPKKRDHWKAYPEVNTAFFGLDDDMPERAQPHVPKASVRPDNAPKKNKNLSRRELLQGLFRFLPAKKEG